MYSQLLTSLDPEKIAQHVDQKVECSFLFNNLGTVKNCRKICQRRQNIVGISTIDELKSRAFFQPLPIALISLPKSLFCPRPCEQGCHCTRAYFSALLEVTN